MTDGKVSCRCTLVLLHALVSENATPPYSTNKSPSWRKLDISLDTTFNFESGITIFSRHLRIEPAIQKFEYLL
ncbi:uncharacterized protein PHALS_10164 [Plasmopara halstedii]|uniref:RxLR-like protein n=1 Tax=Plasmopara halstedii TaxID=4781 RepID=A0A0P1AH40_PLAHL|nr:uncharacterized protein PHALS_10164 [Plasmopara halstedii]CEG39938.1 hypothetical protein PHALS_10164 [Plasmopara halstedii]|eukprot:XP_024576307.1 hypothetical protein PHALS_10164 [Plasmopara halstedii]